MPNLLSSDFKKKVKILLSVILCYADVETHNNNSIINYLEIIEKTNNKIRIKTDLKVIKLLLERQGYYLTLDEIKDGLNQLKDLSILQDEYHCRVEDDLKLLQTLVRTKFPDVSIEDIKQALDDFILTKKLDSNIAIVEAEIWEFTVNLWGDSVEKNLKIFIEFWEKYQNKEINKIINSLSEDQQIIAQRVFIELTDLRQEDQIISRNINIEILIENLSLNLSNSKEIEFVICFLNQEGLLKLDVENEITVVKINEDIICDWLLLKKWWAENRQTLTIGRSIEHHAIQWKNKGKDEAFLMKQSEVNLTHNFYSDHAIFSFSKLAQEYIEQSKYYLNIKKSINKVKQLLSQCRLDIAKFEKELENLEKTQPDCKAFSEKLLNIKTLLNNLYPYSNNILNLLDAAIDKTNQSS
jgi:hypothetical protein